MRWLLHKEKGFTVIELMVVIGIIGILFSMATINLLRAQHNASVSAAVDQLVADMRTQQTKAMIGSTDSSGNANSYGIHVMTNTYVLFSGTTDVGNSSDLSISQPGITFSTTLPGGLMIFTQRSGVMSTTSYTITVKNANGTEQKTLTVNKYGVVTSIQ